MILPINPTRSLVVHQLTGAVLVADSHWWQGLGLNWLNGRLDPRKLPTSYGLDDPHRGQLDEMGFLLTPELHARYTGQLVDFGHCFQQERQTTFFITPQTQQRGCPLACSYCFQKDAGPEEEKLLQPGGAAQVIAFIDRYQAQHGLSSDKICLQLFGGEPVQNRFHDFWEIILEAVKQRGWRWAVVTSGATFTDKMLALFERYAAYGLQEFNITLDGVASVQNALRPFKGGQGTHERVVANVDRLLAMGLPVLLKTNFGKDNIDGYPDHLDFVMDRRWHEGNFVLMVNVIQPFGGVDTGDQKVSEEVLMTKVIEIFRREPYSSLLPILRLEGKKLTGYLANAFGLPFADTADLRRGKPVFDGYPYHAFCNPTKGNSWNIAPDGTLRTCNWMDGHTGFGEGSVFEHEPFTGGRHTNHVACNSHCSTCDISTLCGGGCPIDMKIRPDYYQTCRDEHGLIIQNFVREAVARGWLDLDLRNSPFNTLRSGFDLDYQYRDRFDPARRISDPGCLSVVAA